MFKQQIKFSQMTLNFHKKVDHNPLNNAFTKYVHQSLLRILKYTWTYRTLCAWSPELKKYKYLSPRLNGHSYLGWSKRAVMRSLSFFLVSQVCSKDSVMATCFLTKSFASFESGSSSLAEKLESVTILKFHLEKSPNIERF